MCEEETRIVPKTFNNNIESFENIINGVYSAAVPSAEAAAVTIHTYYVQTCRFDNVAHHRTSITFLRCHCTCHIVRVVMRAIRVSTYSFRAVAVLNS